MSRQGDDIIAVCQMSSHYHRCLLQEGAAILTSHPALGSLKVMSAPDYRDRIVLNSEIRFGKPTIRGTRLTVGDVLSYLAGGMTEAQVLVDFPQLQLEDIRACLAYAAERERRLAS